MRTLVLAAAVSAAALLLVPNALAKGNYLRRDSQVVRISPTLASRIRARLSLS